MTALLFALPINARVTRRRMTRREWTWAALLAVAVAIVVTVGHPSAGHARASITTWAVAIVLIGPALVSCLVAAASVPARGCGAAGDRVGVVVGALRGLDQGRHRCARCRCGDAAADPELYGWLLAALGRRCGSSRRFAPAR
ncbi:hypothetical protein I553_1435 [Mycobacterium xenopi 4042]|uniref:Uncharacterized protein n=1 Tax=Mycobacterium xenopi 4042 TaxID=1299334 RepID=X8CH81_MYCXE|nr:hypothetical protein I553_1435 [Mycobacterium xenopi 4042]